MENDEGGETARLVPSGGHFVALCSEGHKIALVFQHWTIEVLCHCKHAVRIGPDQAGRLGFAVCRNGHKVAEVLRSGTVRILCRCRRHMLIRHPDDPGSGVPAEGART